jgi:hypothetical protein
MENAPKKKKKYVLMKQESSQEQQRPQEGEQAPPALARSRFDYTFDQIINHIFAKLLPDSRFTIRLSERLIFGREKELDALIEALDENIRYYSGLIIEL